MRCVSDIERDLANGELTGIEAAFRALVAGEDCVEGAVELDDLVGLLHPLCTALAYNDRRMPKRLAELILARGGEDVTDAPYAAGAKAVRAFQAHWRTILARRYPALTFVGRLGPSDAVSAPDPKPT